MRPLTLATKDLEGLNLGMLCAGMVIWVFFEIFLAIFWARLCKIKLPKPLKYTFSPFTNDPLITLKNDSTVSCTTALSTPVLSLISLTTSALVICDKILLLVEQKYTFFIIIMVLRLLFGKLSLMSLRNSLIDWYNKSYRDLPWRNTKDPYIIWMSEIILQQTRVEQGLPYFYAFQEKFPSIKSLAEASENDVLHLWQGLGYYSRARNMHATAKHICENLNGIFPSTYAEILELKGVGPYTAAAISSFAFDLPTPVIDGNVERLLSRYFGINSDIKSALAKKELKQALDEHFDNENPAIFNQAMMELGSQICKPKNADCEACPIQLNCFAKTHNRVSEFPVKKNKVKSKEIDHHYLVLQHKDKVLIEQRQSGIWQKLYQFPLVEGKISSNELMDEANQYVASDNSLEIELAYECQHLLSHRKINAHFYTIRSPKPFKKAKSHIFEIDLKHLQNKYPVSVLISKYLSYSENNVK